MKFKKLESGRSMVEMLGVLAIIGVLSVGGIAGYSLSMRRHRANGVVDHASKFALVGYSQCQQKILNGEINDITECVSDDCFYVDGIGNTPAGLASGVCIDEITTDKNTGIDTVSVFTVFSDQKLCQATASIVGTTCSDDRIQIKIKQN